MKTVAITGASGMIATELVSLLLGKGGYEISLISTNPDKYISRWDSGNVRWYTLGQWMDELKKTGKRCDVLINTGFARSSNGVDVSSSLQFTVDVALAARRCCVASFINISSQSVYGKIYEPLWTEETPVAPDYMYALGKYSAELLIDSILCSSSVNYTNVRLSSVCENARFLRVFVQNAIENRPIRVQDGRQSLSFIDVRDVASGLLAMIEKAPVAIFDKIYNLGTGVCNTIMEMAQMVKKIALEKYGIQVEIIVEEANLPMHVGMNPGKFKETFGWKPAYDLEKMICSLFNYLKYSDLGGGYPISWKMINL